MNSDSAEKGIESPRQGLPSSYEPHTSATICVILNVMLLLGSIPVWIMARKAAVWSGSSENWDAFFLSLVGWGILIVQVVIALVVLVVLLCKFKEWTRRETWICTAMLPLPVVSTLLAFVYFYGSL